MRSLVFPHFSGPADIESMGCNVVFTAYVPHDLDLCPYVIWVSRGTHIHPPPPFNSAPQAIIKDLCQTIQRIGPSGLTPGKYLDMQDYKLLMHSSKASLSSIY